MNTIQVYVYYSLKISLIYKNIVLKYHQYLKITSIYKIITNKDKQIDRQNRQSDRQTNKQTT